MFSKLNSKKRIPIKRRIILEGKTCKIKNFYNFEEYKLKVNKTKQNRKDYVDAVYSFCKNKLNSKPDKNYFQYMKIIKIYESVFSKKALKLSEFNNIKMIIENIGGFTKEQVYDYKVKKQIFEFNLVKSFFDNKLNTNKNISLCKKLIEKQSKIILLAENKKRLLSESELENLYKTTMFLCDVFNNQNIR
jgi:hypothetical protein